MRKSPVSPGNYEVTEADVTLFNRHLRNFVPPGAFDAHAHFYDRSHIGPTFQTSYLKDAPQPGGWVAYQEQVSKWMRDRTPSGGLFFPMPRKGMDMAAANRFLAEQTAHVEQLKALMLIQPKDDPDQVDDQIEAHGFVGLKVYLVYADRLDPYNAEIAEFLPEWAWQISNQRGLAIMLHMVKPQAIADTANQNYIREHCLRYPDTNLILAHCARSFNVGHILEGLESLRGLDNIYFDNSSICEPQPVEEILRIFGPTRLMFGTDFPVSELRGRAVSSADGFIWLSPTNVDWSTAAFGTNTVLGLESVLALKQGCQRMHLTDSDIEQIFFRNAHQLFNIGKQTSGQGQALYREAKKIIPGGTQLLSKRPGMVCSRPVAGLLPGSSRLHVGRHGRTPLYRHELYGHRLLPARICRSRCDRGRGAPRPTGFHVNPQCARRGRGGPITASAPPLGPERPVHAGRRRIVGRGGPHCPGGNQTPAGRHLRLSWLARLVYRHERRMQYRPTEGTSIGRN